MNMMMTNEDRADLNASAGAPSRGSIRPIEALQKGLTILKEIGRSGADVPCLVAATGINRTTVYRILHTLEHEGYLIRSPSDHRFRLAPAVRQLSHGFTDALWVTHIAMPILLQLLRETSWPANVATFNGRHMLFRESCHRFSSYLVHRPIVGTTAPMATALGQAFLAFSDKAVRAPLLDAFIADWAASGLGDLGPRQAEQQLARVKSRGYATQINVLDPGVGGVAMPVIRGNQVLACIGITAPSNVVASSVLLRAIVGPLRAAVDQATRELANQLY